MSYSEIRSARLAASGLPLSFQPVPARDFVRYRWVVPAGERSALPYELRDLTGRLLQSGRLQPSGGSLNVASLAPGIYLLRAGDHPVTRLVKY